MASVSWDRRGEARAALRAIVSDPNYGVAALSSPQVMSSLLKDLLPDAQREAGVLVAAAEAGLASTLAGYRAQGMDLGTATALAMESFATRTAFTADACHWAVSELAAAAGFDADAAGQGSRRPAAPARTAPPRDWQRVTTGAVTGTRAGHRRPPRGGERPADTQETSRMALKGWRARRGLLLLIAIPTAALAVLGGIRIASSVQSALAYQRAEERAVLASDITQLAQRLETERDQTIYYIALGPQGRAGDLSKTAPAGQYKVIQAFYRQTDQSAAQFRARLTEFHGAYTGVAQQEVSSAVAGLDTLHYLRYGSTRTQLSSLVVVQKYADLIDNLLVIDDQTAQGTGDPALSQTVQVLGLVSRMKEEASQQRAILSAALLAGNLNQAEASALSTAQANQQSSQQAFNLSATPAQRAQFNNTVSGSFVYLAASQEQQAAALQTHAHSLAGDSLTAAGFYDAMSSGINQMGSVERELASQVFVRADALRSNAITAGIIAFLLLIALALLFAAVLGAAMTRRLWRRHHVSGYVAPLRLPVARKGQREQLADGFQGLDQRRGGAVPRATGAHAPMKEGRGSPLS
jgi:hypothetical protein